MNRGGAQLSRFLVDPVSDLRGDSLATLRKEYHTVEASHSHRRFPVSMTMKIPQRLEY